MIIGYARVSTEEQHLGLQLDALEEADCDHVYKDQGVSAVAKRCLLITSHPKSSPLSIS